MSKKMTVVAVKVTGDKGSFKIAYEKNGKTFVRSGEDHFIKGSQVHGTADSLWKWGFRKVENPPVFRDSEDMEQNYERFQMKADGSVAYAD